MSKLYDRIKKHKIETLILTSIVTSIVAYFVNFYGDLLLKDEQKQQNITNISYSLYNLTVNVENYFYFNTDTNNSKIIFYKANIGFFIENIYKQYKDLKKNRKELRKLYKTIQKESKTYDKLNKSDLSKQLNLVFLKLDHNLSLPISHYKEVLNEFYRYYKQGNIQVSLKSNIVLSNIKTAGKSLIETNKNLKMIKKDIKQISKKYKIPSSKTFYIIRSIKRTKYQ